MIATEISALKAQLSTPKSIVIVPHKNPDGDAIGSTLALYHYFKDFKHNAVVIAPNDYPEFLKWMPGEANILQYDTNTIKADTFIANADLIFTLDFNALFRAGDMANALEKAKGDFVMIDHHQQPSDYAAYMYSDVSMSSTCEMVYNFIGFLDDEEKITADIATCIYTGIMTDTGSFRFPSTSSATHRIIARLIELGADNAQIHNNIYDTNSYERLQLLGCALSNLKVLPEYNTSYITLSQTELDKYNFQKGDTEGVVNYGLSLKGIRFAAIFIENTQEGIIKISFRSKGSFSVNEFSRAHFNGGGHTNAAGGRSNQLLEETVEKFISILPAYKTALNL